VPTAVFLRRILLILVLCTVSVAHVYWSINETKAACCLAVQVWRSPYCRACHYSSVPSQQPPIY
jgi:hypothetical protein